MPSRRPDARDMEAMNPCSGASVGSATRRTFQLHHIAFRIGDVDRRAFSLGSVPGCQWSRFYVVRAKLAANGGFVERIDAKAEVIEVPSFLPRRRTTGLAKLTIHRDEVDEGAPGAPARRPFTTSPDDDDRS